MPEVTCRARRQAIEMVLAGRSYGEVALVFEIHETTVFRWCKEEQIRSKATCQHCGNEFQRKTGQQYCHECRPFGREIRIFERLLTVLPLQVVERIIRERVAPQVTTNAENLERSAD